MLYKNKHAHKNRKTTETKKNLVYYSEINYLIIIDP